MAYEQKPNTGSMFANDRKTEETHADRTGSALIECPHCGKSWQSWLNGWLKKTKDGKPFLSLSFRPKEARQGASQGQSRQGSSQGQGRQNPQPQGSQGGGNRYASRRDDYNQDFDQPMDNVRDEIPF